MSEGTSPLYLIATDNGKDDAYRISREAGLRLAKDDGAAVVLYDRSSESYLTDPYPVGPWSDEDDAVSAESKLEPETLENLGRGYLATQLREAREAGLEAEAYLGQGSGAEALQRAIERYHPSLVVLPDEVDKASLLDRLGDNTLEDFKEKVDAELRLVDRDGNFRSA